MIFTIDRSKWRCGGDDRHKVGRGKISLLNASGFMCCLGQTCSQLGVKKKDLLNLAEPSELQTDYSGLSDIFFNLVDEGWNRFFLKNTNLSHDAIDINDDDEIGQTERERKLKELFKSHGHQIKFTGKIIAKK